MRGLEGGLEGSYRRLSENEAGLETQGREEEHSKTARILDMQSALELHL
jgi:hypothetical protein